MDCRGDGVFSSLFLDLFFLSFFVRLGEDMDLGEDADFIIAVAAPAAAAAGEKETCSYLQFKLFHEFEILSTHVTNHTIRSHIFHKMDPAAVAKMKLAASTRTLQRLDPKILEILSQSFFTVLYEMQTNASGLKSWAKCNIEGNLFIVKRSEPCRFQLIILNRADPTNFVVDIEDTFKVQFNDPYLIFRSTKKDGTPEVRGIWFANPEERGTIQSMLENLAKGQKSDVDLQAGGLSPKFEPVRSGVDEAATGALLGMLGLGGEKEKGQGKALNAWALGGEKASEVLLKKQGPGQGQQRKTNLSSSPSSNPNPNSNSNSDPNDIVLDRKSLQLTLLSLIKDDRFVDLIHAKYLQVASARANNGGNSNNSNNNSS